MGLDTRPHAPGADGRQLGSLRSLGAGAPGCESGGKICMTTPLPSKASRQPDGAQLGTPDRTAGVSIARSSSGMALGTLASRGTGLVRTLIQAYALGGFALADAYNVANSLPNAVYNLMLGGILTSVIVPLLVSASGRGRDRGEAYDQRMF